MSSPPRNRISLMEPPPQRRGARVTPIWNRYPEVLPVPIESNNNDLIGQLFPNANYNVENANFSKYVKGYNAAAYVYDLFGVCNHGGGVQGGHYTAYIKNANGKWYDFNDTNVNEMSAEKIISPHSYCLFYRKKK